MINFVLLIAAYAAASIVPFELRLASYAFLGPAHYLTEISWLHDRGYFCQRRLSLLLPLTGATAAVVIFAGYWELYVWLAVSGAVAVTLARDARQQLLLFALLGACYPLF